ncbi:MAG: hypothetical protein ABGU93_07030 [Acetobacterium sp.]|uniref:hypothetical protein n=1 Tax=Acetobacterium sp. TaxID=1872094 RepID=UPI003241D1D9
MVAVVDFINNYLLLFAVMVVFFGLLIFAIDRHYEHKANRKDDENETDEFIVLDNDWLQNNEIILKNFENDYLGIVNIDILNLEMLQIDEKIGANRGKIKGNKGVSDVILQLIFLLISFGLGFGILDNITTAISAVGNNQMAVALEKSMLYIFYFMFLVISIFIIVIIPYFIVSLAFKGIIKNNDSKNKELNLENHNLMVRKIAIKNCIKKLEKTADT